MSIEYYDENAKEYFDKSVNLDMSYIYPYFLKHLKKGAKILDVGCGSGRDSKIFLLMGYDVTSIDGSKELAKITRDYIEKEVIIKDFKEIVYDQVFDGIWAMASLLHLPKSETLQVYQNLFNSLKENGVMYVSYKIGSLERCDNEGRLFNDYTEEKFRQFISSFKDIHIEDIFITDSKMNNQDTFINAILIKK